MSAELDLGGDCWQFRGCLGGSWRWYTCPDKPWDGPGWLPGRVPGSVTDDLWWAGQVPDPYHERNSLLLEWVPHRAWVYRRRLETVALRDGEPATLVFADVDHRATVVVDGDVVG
ncbi:MAG: glycosyl hydrolase 2 galactose-binding domain-containing protein [Acidimicrobiales bacterium]